MPTWKQVADDIMDAMGYTHDDALRHRGAVLYNVSIVANKLRRELLNRDAKSGDELSNSDFLSTYIVPVTHRDVADDVVNEWDASYFDLPTPIMDISNGGGLNMVRYLRNDIPMGCKPAVARTPFSKATLAGLNTIYNSAYQAPKPSQPYFARAKAGNADRVYLFGVPGSIQNLLVALYASTDFAALDPDDDADIPDNLLLTLKKMVVDMEAWALQIPQERLKSDGRDFEPNQTVQTRPAISINDEAQRDT